MRIGKLEIGRVNAIYLQPVNGLGNRLRAIQSLYKIAINTGRKLKIYWGPSEGFSTIAFDELFDMSSVDTAIEFITEKEYFNARRKYLCVDAYVKQGTDYKYYVRDKELVIDTILNSSFCLTTSSCIEFMFSDSRIAQIYRPYKYNCWVSSLRPIKKIDDKIKEVTSKFDKNTIGIHIRKGDAATGPHKDFYAVSKDELFYSQISKHDGKVFVATDDEETQENLLRAFGDKIIVYEDKKFLSKDITISDAKPNQTDALIDMFCLAGTQKLYGTNWSTFSTIAAELSGITLSKVGTGKKKETTGIVCGVMNREAMLKVSLASWLNVKEVSEIVIVDWCSKNSLKYLEKLDARIKVVRVENQKYFNVAKSKNLGMNESTCDKVLILDVDYIINPYYDIKDAFPPLTKKNFITGSWKDGDIDNRAGFIMNLNGFVYLYRDTFFHAGGYSSDFEGYGWDDDDLYNKLQDIGYTRDYIMVRENRYIYHNPHSDSDRIANYQDKDLKSSAKKNRKKAKAKFYGISNSEGVNFKDESCLEGPSFNSSVSNNRQNRPGEAFDNLC